MSKGGGTQTSTTSIDPDVKAAYMGNLDYAQQVANQLGTQQFAGFNPQYTAGEAQIERAAQGGIGTQNLDTAANLTRAAAGYAPQNVLGANAGNAAMATSAGYGATDVAAAQANMANIGQYMNPYTNEVINASMSDLEKARQQAAQQISQQAGAARAFGGSRHGVAQALSNQQFGETAGKTISQLRAQGFDVASNLMQQDLARQQQGYNQAFGAAQMRSANAFDPFATLLGQQYGMQTSNVGNNQQLFNQGTGFSSGAFGNQYVQQAFNPYNNYAADVYGSNFNAANARQIANSNNSAASDAAKQALLGQALGSLFRTGVQTNWRFGF